MWSMECEDVSLFSSFSASMLLKLNEYRCLNWGFQMSDVLINDYIDSTDLEYTVLR